MARLTAPLGQVEIHGPCHLVGDGEWTELAALSFDHHRSALEVHVAKLELGDLDGPEAFFDHEEQEEALPGVGSDAEQGLDVSLGEAPGDRTRLFGPLMPSVGSTLA